MIFARLVWALILSTLVTVAAAAPLTGPIGNNAGPIYYGGPEIGLIGAASGIGGGGGGCDGTIDLSTGCVQPMLGVM